MSAGVVTGSVDAGGGGGSSSADKVGATRTLSFTRNATWSSVGAAWTRHEYAGWAKPIAPASGIARIGPRAIVASRALLLDDVSMLCRRSITDDHLGPKRGDSNHNVCGAAPPTPMTMPRTRSDASSRVKPIAVAPSRGITKTGTAPTSALSLPSFRTRWRGTSLSTRVPYSAYAVACARSPSIGGGMKGRSPAGKTDQGANRVGNRLIHVSASGPGSVSATTKVSPVVA